MSRDSHRARVPLPVLAPGQRARLAEVGREIDPAQREQLAAYGLSPGAELTVLQQRPMTVILADELELAFEPAVARDIWVEVKR